MCERLRTPCCELIALYRPGNYLSLLMALHMPGNYLCLKLSMFLGMVKLWAAWNSIWLIAVVQLGKNEYEVQYF